VTTTHLAYYSAIQRAAQVERLRGLQAEAAGHAQDAAHPHKEGGPFETVPRPASSVLTADFNFRPEDPLYARIQAPIGAAVPAYRDSWAVAHPGAPHAHTLGVYDKILWPGDSYCCDFIFVTEDLAPRVEAVAVNADTDASDHQPVLLTLRG
jgi:endonuclease/exonuclease/phosphatase family metal-dependent hydrolase